MMRYLIITPVGRPGILFQFDADMTDSGALKYALALVDPGEQYSAWFTPDLPPAPVDYNIAW